MRLALHRQPFDLQGSHLELRALASAAGFVVDEDVSPRGALGAADEAEARRLANGFDAVAGVELVHGVADVFLDRMPAEEEALADLRIRQALGDERQHLQLLAGELWRKLLRHLAAIVVRCRSISTQVGGSEPASRGLFASARVLDAGAMRNRALASGTCVLLLAAAAAFAPSVARADDAVAEQTSESTATSSATNDNSVSQNATATQSGASGSQSQTIEQNAPTQQTATPSANSTQSPANVSAGGSASQHASSSSAATAGNVNHSTQATSETQNGLSTSSGQSQGTSQTSPTSQRADALATSTQVAPTNVNVVVRIDSPGNDGPVTQSNISQANAVAGNTNTVSQDAAQGQAAPVPNSGQAQSSVQSAPTTQTSQANAASTQIAPLNANIVIRNKSPGDSGAVIQTNDSQATAQAGTQNAVDQSADQAQAQADANAAGGQSQSVVQHAPTTQSSTAEATSTQTAAANAGLLVSVDGSALSPDGSGRHGLLITIWLAGGDPLRELPVAQSSTSTTSATAANSNAITQAASQTQSGGRVGGSQVGGGAESQTVVQEAATTQTSTSTASGTNQVELRFGDAVGVVGGSTPVDGSGGWSIVPFAAISGSSWSRPDDHRSARVRQRPRRSDSRTGSHRRVPIPQPPDDEKASLGAGVDRGGSDGGLALLLLAFALTARWWARRQAPSALRRLMAVVSRPERPG